MLTAINNSKIDISSIESIKELAEKFINHLGKGSIVFLYGEIGVGKTTFIKYFINKYQKNNNSKITEVTSPTFNLLNEYKINDLVIKHFDLYRLKNKSEINNLGLFENSNEAITFIEWPELVDKKNILKSVKLTFSYENDLNNRFIKISGLA
tara:strand:- start:1597 stop:2052 length:456 start_codon:yes stop_codon:yes gene_type:complete